jgi:hypothetical protein
MLQESPFEIAVRLVYASFRNANVALHPISSKETTADAACFCTNVDLAILIFQRSDRDGIWFDLDCGIVPPEGTEYFEHAIRVSYCARYGADGTRTYSWKLVWNDTSETRTLLDELDPLIVTNAGYYRNNDDRARPDNAFFLDVIARMIARLSDMEDLTAFIESIRPSALTP